MSQLLSELAQKYRSELEEYITNDDYDGYLMCIQDLLYENGLTPDGTYVRYIDDCITEMGI